MIAKGDQSDLPDTILLDRGSLPRLTHADEWIASLGDIPLDRIRVDVWPGTATEDDVLRLDDRGIAICELVDGVLVEKTVGTNESLIAANILFELMQHVRANKLGIVLGADGMLRLFADRRDIRIPDVSFIPNDQLDNGKLPATDSRVAQIVPALAVEVLSQGNTTAEMDRKLREYLQAGTKLVWLVDPKTQSVAVYTAPETSITLQGKDTLDGGSALPGFLLPVTEVFA
jgi:Uma2 family endonuclease